MDVLDEDRELALEDEAIHLGKLRYHDQVQRLVKGQMESRTNYGKRRVSQAIVPVAEAIQKFCTAKAGPGRRHTAIKFLKQLPYESTAVMALRVLIDSIAFACKLTTTCDRIGSQIEYEVKFAHFEKENKPLYKKIVTTLANNAVINQQKGAQASTISNAMEKFNIEWDSWNKQEKIIVGAKLLEIIIETTGWVEIVKVRQGKRTTSVVQTTQAFRSWIEEAKDYGELMNPVLLPMVAPPIPWTNSQGGGGYYKIRFRRPLIKKFNKEYQREVSGLAMPTVFETVNAMQSTPWVINAAMMTVLSDVWEEKLQDIKGMAPLQPKERPPKPGDIKTNEVARREWKQNAAAIYRKNRQDDSKRTQYARIKFLAEKFLTEKSIYFPVQLDFRGRLYYMPSHLNPQGCDLAKSLLTFAEKKPLGESGAKWLAIHCANTFGYDKCSLAEREQWARDNSEMLCRCANDPVGTKEWRDADKPWQFLAACVEWAGYVTDGPGYETGLPILVDGSCNGIQHFSAMLRDEEAGCHVNLVPGRKPGDIYQAVADEVNKKLTTMTDDPLAVKWLKFGLDRKSVKRPVMVLPYGGTRDAVRKYLSLHVSERVNEGEAEPFDRSENGKALHLLALIVWETMEKVVVGPMKVMSWLRDVAKLVAAEKLPIVWTTPSGFLVSQTYRNQRHYVVRTRVGDTVYKMSVSEDTEHLDPRKQAQAIAPNFVHSLDASTLALTVVKAQTAGIHDFVAIHDSYGTHAADMDKLQVCIRDVFVDLYENTDVLMDFAKQISAVLPEGVSLPEAPPRGNLDITQVRNSEFFFA